MPQVTQEDLDSAARFMRVTVDNIRSLRDCQRHDGAMRTALALRGLVNTVRESQPVQGLMADLAFGAELAERESICGEFGV